MAQIPDSRQAALGAASDYASRVLLDCDAYPTDLISDGLEYRDNWPSSQRVSPLEHYREGRAHLRVNMRSSADAHIFDLVFCRIPPTVSNRSSTLDGASKDLGGGSYRLSDGYDEPVGVRITNAVKTPEKVIPSFVWIEPHKKAVQFRWIVPQSPASEFTFHPFGVPSEGEACFRGAGVAEANSSSKAGVVQSVPQMRSRFLDHQVDVVRQEAVQLNLEDLLSGVSIYLDNGGVWPCLEEGFDQSFGLVNVLLCASDKALRAREWVLRYHD